MIEIDTQPPTLQQRVLEAAEQRRRETAYRNSRELERHLIEAMIIVAPLDMGLVMISPHGQVNYDLEGVRFMLSTYNTYDEENGQYTGQASSLSARLLCTTPRCRSQAAYGSVNQVKMLADLDGLYSASEQVQDNRCWQCQKGVTLDQRDPDDDGLSDLPF